MDAAILEKASIWLSDLYDEETRNKVQHLIDNDPTELTESFYTDLDFGTGGLRGIMGVGTNRMNIYTVAIATQGLANYLNACFGNAMIRVAIAHDSRNNSNVFARKAAEVLSANGIQVYLFESLRPTPELSFAVRELGCQSGIVITASHNPKEYNGYKVYWEDGGQLVPPHDKNVIREVRAISSIKEVKTSADTNLIKLIGSEIDDKYVDALKKISLRKGKASDLSIVYTPIHGTGIQLTPRVLNAFGFSKVSVVEAQATPDGNFSTVHSPNPEEAAALDLAIQQAGASKADLVLGTDPDADRVGIAIPNHQGQYILLNGNQTACILIHFYLSEYERIHGLLGHEFIARTIVTTPLIDKIAQAFEVDVEICLTGFKWIAELIRLKEDTCKYLIGGEESYGYLIGDFVRDKDAVASSLMIAEAAAWARDRGMSLYDLLLEVYLKYGFFKEHLVSLTKKGRSGAEEIASMMEKLRKNPPAELAGIAVAKVRDYKLQVEHTLANKSKKAITLPVSNVIQLELEDGSLITARPSGTEPKIKFYFSVIGELNSREDYVEAEKALDSKIQQMVNELNLA